MNRRIWIAFFAMLILGGCRAGNSLPADQTRLTPASPALPDLGQAPELTSEVWLNTALPLRLTDMQGKVILLDMWTFG